MTQYLCEAARQVLAVEIDTNLIPILQDTLSEYDNVQVLNQDILKVDINALANEYNNGKPIKVVANLPYYITTPIYYPSSNLHIGHTYCTVMADAMDSSSSMVQTGRGAGLADWCRYKTSRRTIWRIWPMPAPL